MKRNKFREFINGRGQYAAVFAFIVVAGICAGAAALNRSGQETALESGQSAGSGAQIQTPTVSEPVLTNKNAENGGTNGTNSTSGTGGVNDSQTQSVPQSDAQNNASADAENNTAILDSEEGDDLEIVMQWPVDGDILLGYSPNTPLYDVTLDQYRTTDDVCISASVGDAVTAAAGGTVTEVVEDEDKGSYVVIEHGNGWATTYSQLSDISLSVGEAVEQGETIGKVAEPSIYSSAMGPHVEFKVTLDDRAVNPEAAVG